MFEFTKTVENEVVVLALKGQLDALTAGKIKPFLDSLLNGDAVRVVFDLSELTLLDSSGVGVIVSTFKRSRAKGGDTKLAAMQGQPREVFKILNFIRYIEVYNTVDEAVEKISKE